MIRFLFLFITVTAILIVGMNMFENPGSTKITWFQYDIELTTSVFVILMIYVILALAAILLGINWLLGLPEKWLMKRKLEKQKTGHELVTKALISIYSGEVDEGKKWITKAQKYKPYMPLFHLLMSEIQQKSHNQKKEKEHLVKLLDYPETKLFAYKGLIQDQIHNGFTEKALEKIEELIAEYSHVEWVIETRLRLLARFHYWHKALETLKLGVRKNLYTREQHFTIAANIYCQMAANSYKNDQLTDARQWAEKSVAYAMKLDHYAFPQGYVLLAMIYRKAGHQWRFQKILKKGWSKSPHPDLQQLHYDTIKHLPGHKKIDAVKSFIRVFPEHFESQYYLATIYYNEKLWGQVRTILENLDLQNCKESRLFSLFAKLEEAEFPDHPKDKRDQWLAKEKNGSDSNWVCGNCGTTHTDWHAICSKCHSFGEISWSNHYYDEDIIQIADIKQIEKVN